MAQTTEMDIPNSIHLSDNHGGCRVGLHPPHPVRLLDMVSHPTALQLKLWDWWLEFHNEWIPRVTRGEPYILVHGGDGIDGRHHGAVSQITQNTADQATITRECLAPVIDRPMCKGLFWIKGTEAHVGQSGENEETLARSLGAIPGDDGQHARFELWLQLGGHCLIHDLHHIGTTGSMAYETTALMKEYSESCAEAARWGLPAPDVVIRHHRHRHAEIRVPTYRGYGICFTTAGWQLKTPFVWRLPGGRLTLPQIGGSLVRQGNEEFYTRHFTRSLSRTPVVALGKEAVGD